MLCGSYKDNKVSWFENKDGRGTFGGRQVITNGVDGVECVIAADVNGDGAADVVSASDWDDRIAWYANSGKSGNGTCPPAHGDGGGGRWWGVALVCAIVLMLVGALCVWKRKRSSYRGGGRGARHVQVGAGAEEGVEMSAAEAAHVAAF